MSSSRPASVPLALAALFAGRAAAHHHRYLFYLACGRSVVVLVLQSVDPFGFSSQFVGLDNFVTLFHDSYYLDAPLTTIKFSTFVTVSGLLVSLFFAALVEYIVRGSRFYQTLDAAAVCRGLAVAAVLWIFLFNPGRGLITHFLAEFVTPEPRAKQSGDVPGGVWLCVEANQLQLSVLLCRAAIHPPFVDRSRSH